MNDAAPGLTPGLRAILDGLADKGRPGAALAAGLDFVFHNWAGLIDEGDASAEDDFASLWEIMDSYAATLAKVRGEVLAGLDEAAGKPPHAMPDGVAAMLSVMEDRDIHQIAAADTVREMFTGWSAALAAGEPSERLAAEYGQAEELLAAVSGPAREALRSAAEPTAPGPSAP